MSDIVCSRCGATNPGDAAFCKACGTPFAAAAPPPPATAPPGVYPSPPPGGYPPPPQGYSPAPPGSYPPGAYPVVPGAAKVTGKNTQMAFGCVGICVVIFFGLFNMISPLLNLIGPVAAVAGAVWAKKDMTEAASGRAPQLNEGSAKGAYYANLAFLVIDVVAILYYVSKAA
jgi:hypothetical protein